MLLQKDFPTLEQLHFDPAEMQFKRCGYTGRNIVNAYMAFD